MSSGNNQINFVSGNDSSSGTSTPFAGGSGVNALSGTLGAFLWAGFQSGAERRPGNPPTSQFFM
jgi:hypothetical protein